jgi:hypothetical protein
LGSNTENICKSIVDSYYEFYAPYMVQDARVTLSVQKSDHIDAVINSFVE